MDFSALNDRMVSGQLIPRGVKDPAVLRAFRAVPRHKFVSAELEKTAYADHPLPIGSGQTISQPYIAALMTESLRVGKNEKVLEIGTGSGYQAAILAELAKEVYTVERIEKLARSAELNLDGAGYANIKIKIGDGTIGWPEHAPYDAIMITAGAPKIPNALVDQLKSGGRLIAPVGGNFSQTLTLLEKIGDKTVTTEICGCVFVPLIGEDGWAA